mmetsp:Transcript_102943/g.231166  ORF Transcript_102943/g.231166 Transcript_102943/m.231166 type:complete len:218 (+) Transcript_102943:312-965(+)
MMALASAAGFDISDCTVPTFALVFSGSVTWMTVSVETFGAVKVEGEVPIRAVAFDVMFVEFRAATTALAKVAAKLASCTLVVVVRSAASLMMMNTSNCNWYPVFKRRAWLTPALAFSPVEEPSSCTSHWAGVKSPQRVVRTASSSTTFSCGDGSTAKVTADCSVSSILTSFTASCVLFCVLFCTACTASLSSESTTPTFSLVTRVALISMRTVATGA